MDHKLKYIAYLAFSILIGHVDAEVGNVQKSELKQINGQIQSIQSSITHDKKYQTTLQQALKETEIKLASLAQEVSQLEKAKQYELHEITKLKKREDILKHQLIQQHQSLADQIQAAYKLGKFNEIKMLLDQEDPSTLNRHLKYYRYLTQQRLAIIDQAKETLFSLNQTLQAKEEHQQQLQTLLKQIQLQLEKQETIQISRQDLISQLNQDVQTKEQQLASLIANRRFLQEEVNRLQNQPIEVMTHQPFAKLSGKLFWPVKGNIIANFGSPLDVGEQRLAGVIIKAPTGTPIHAIAAGKIIFANWLRGFGLLIIINHGNGYMSLYARNQNIYTKVGNPVKAGDIIATTGNTGGYETSSLYFEIRENGIPINPSLWCRNT